MADKKEFKSQPAYPGPSILHGSMPDVDSRCYVKSLRYHPKTGVFTWAVPVTQRDIYRWRQWTQKKSPKSYHIKPKANQGNGPCPKNGGGDTGKD